MVTCGNHLSLEGHDHAAAAPAVEIGFGQTQWPVEVTGRHPRQRLPTGATSSLKWLQGNQGAASLATVVGGL